MQYICSKTGDEVSIYAARQGMRAAYMQQNRDEGSIYAARQGMRAVYKCSKTGNEGSIYATRQGMRACNNNNMRNPIIKEM